MAAMLHCAAMAGSMARTEPSAMPSTSRLVRRSVMRCMVWRTCWRWCRSGKALVAVARSKGPCGESW